MTGPPSKKSNVSIPTPSCVVDILNEIAKVPAQDVEEQGKRLEPVKETDKTLGVLEPYAQKIVTLWLQKAKGADSAADKGDVALASDLFNEAAFLYSMLDFMVYNAPSLREETRGWAVCEGFMLVMRDGEDEVLIDVDLEEEDEDDVEDGEDEKPVRRNPDRKKLH